MEYFFFLNIKQKTQFKSLLEVFQFPALFPSLQHKNEGKMSNLILNSLHSGIISVQSYTYSTNVF